jgi:hypothetical protein
MSRNKTLRLLTALGLTAGAVLAPTVAVSPAQASSGLCAVNSDYADEDWISSVKVGTSQPATSEQGVTYKDATTSSLGTFEAGSTNNQIEITANVDIAAEGSDAWEEHIFVWLDLNQDGVVDLNNEQIFTVARLADDFTIIDNATPNLRRYTFTGNFSIPSNAYNGSAVGRAMLQYVAPGDQPYLCNSDPAGYDPGVSAFEAGSVLDFKIGITGGVTKPSLANTGSDYQGLLLIAGLLLTLGATLPLLRAYKR